MTLGEVLKICDSLAPLTGAEEWDNVGLMVGDPDREINSVLVALDPSTAVIDRACSTGCNLIVTHHPLLFSPLSCLDLSTPMGGSIARLVEERIGLISLHTNLDRAPGGVADTLAEHLGLEVELAEGALRVGTLAADVDLREWAAGLAIPGTRIVDCGHGVSRVGLCPGSGMSGLARALELGCDTFVTGDVKYHQACDAHDLKINVVDLGHWGSEHLVVPVLARRLGEMLPGMRIDAFDGADIFTNL